MSWQIMNNRVKPVEGGPISDGRRITITLSLETDDVPRFLETFRDGKLSGLGVIDCQVTPEQLPANSKKRWCTGELGKRTCVGSPETGIRWVRR